MRIIAGTARGTVLYCPEGLGIRPTPDRLRASLFDSIGDAIAGARVIDLFAGTGAMGIEALSRGAARARLVDGGAEAIAAIRRNLERTGLGARATVVRTDLLRPGANPFGRDAAFAFVSPPYGLYEEEEGRAALGRLIRSLLVPGTLAPVARVFLQFPHKRAADAAAIAGPRPIRRTREQGSNGFLEIALPAGSAPCER
ncbi:MAG: RsmD family RNA methyltransferase [Planctomycetes bacterium]|nr:RsmD family RNA methyltransferase [Planctomycetota bacterium]